MFPLIILAFFGTARSWIQSRLAFRSSFSVALASKQRLPMASTTSVLSDVTETSTTDKISQSLAGSYVIRCAPESDTPNAFVWSLYPLDDDHDNELNTSHPHAAWQAVTAHQTDNKHVSDKPANSIRVILDDKTNTLQCKWKNTDIIEKDSDLFTTLEAVAVQWAASQMTSPTKQWDTVVSNGERTVFTNGENPTNLFQTTLDKIRDAEWVEMVDQLGRPLGRVPRPLVHTHNLLHRGIGLFVSKDRSIFESSVNDLPDLYVHQRTSTKRIFPSLYDMFVGGVATAGESSLVTAQREVAEELGLTDVTHLSKQPLLKCVVCTGYNRCVVDLFEYVVDTSIEQISWQAEEVAWGSFCSYDVIEAAADLSIRRLETKGTWPGSFPAIQSPKNGELSHETTDSAWETWDFVPDGLLVWEAWLRWRADQAS